MNIDKKIEELRKEFNNKIDELKKEYKEKNEKWIPEVGEKYYFIDEELNVDWQWFDNDDTDEVIFKYNKVFFFVEEAQAFIDKYRKQILKFEFGIEEE